MNAATTIRSRSGLDAELTLSAGKLLDLFYEGFDRSFVLPNEKEEKAGFAECLALNEGAEHARLVAQLGAFREVVLVARDGGVQVGGANFIAYRLNGGKTVAMNLNYLYVLPEQRRKGYFGRLLEAVGEVAREVLGAEAGAETLIFIEQNDPLKMSAEDYERDTQHSGLDQVERLHMWGRLGARIVDVPYVQPPLSAQQDADDTLLYSVLGARSDSLDACLLRAHLERFFGISVLKGAPLDGSPPAREQLDQLKDACARGEAVALLDPSAVIARLRAQGVSAYRHVGDTRVLARALR
jgi:GNAT superfamily N-acetyltransferase